MSCHVATFFSFLLGQNHGRHPLLFSGLRAHELRAIAASLALSRGASIQDVLDAVGWRSASTFITHYWRQVDLTQPSVALPSI